MMPSNATSYYVNSIFATTTLGKHNNTKKLNHLVVEYFPADNLPESEFPNGINCSTQAVAKQWMTREFASGFVQINCKVSRTTTAGRAQDCAYYRCKVPECAFRFRLRAN